MREFLVLLFQDLNQHNLVFLLYLHVLLEH
jgi:hypothetical protein